jgi:peptide/nickel transport system substrate-binding protein
VLVAVVAGAGAAASRGDTQVGYGPHRFADLRVAYDTELTYLDPGLPYTVGGAQIMWNEYLGLVGYRHSSGRDGATILPYLAESLPTITNHGRTYTFTLRRGLVYSNGKPVRARDFRATIERVLQIGSSGAGFYDDVVGAEAFAAGNASHVIGIVTNDRTRKIKIDLLRPQGDFLNRLALPYAALVPTGTPPSDRSTTPIPSTGPYVTRSYQPNRSVVIVRNPSWAKNRAAGVPVPDGNPDRITIQIVASDSLALKRTLANEFDYDFAQPPRARLAFVLDRYRKRVRTYMPGNTFYFFMNTRTKPFDQLRVRRAVEYALDRRELARMYGELGRPTQNILPPTSPQYRRLDLYPYDLARAAKLVRACKCERTPITIWDHDVAVDREAGQYLQQQLRTIGFADVRLKIVNSQVYWTLIGRRSTRAQIGFADWYQDYPSPSDWLDVLFNGRRITALHNGNYGNVDIRAVDATIDRLRKQWPLTPRLNGEWAGVDRALMANAAAAPFVNLGQVDVFGSAMRLDGACYTNHLVYAFDYAQSCKLAPRQGNP